MEKIAYVPVADDLMQDGVLDKEMNCASGVRFESHRSGMVSLKEEISQPSGDCALNPCQSLLKAMLCQCVVKGLSYGKC